MDIPVLVERLLFMLALVILGLVASRITRLDKSLCCVTAGLAGGQLIPLIGFDTGIRATNIRDIVFYLMLPLLIFATSWSIKPRLLRRWLWPILLLATVGVLGSALLIAVLSYLGINHPAGFPYIAALLLGAILAATDPSAITSLIQQYKGDENLATIFEGESLFNDASAIILFTVVLGLATQSDAAHQTNPFVSFLSTFFGGLVLGAVAGLITSIFVLLLNQKTLTAICLFSLSLTAYYVAEDVVHVSGIVTIMAAAISSKLLLHEQQDELLSHIEATWDWLAELLSLSLYMLMGLVTVVGMFTDQWLAMLIAIVASTLARFVTIYSLALPFGKSTKAFQKGWKPLLAWGGLRGVIAIALVLSLPVSLPYWWTVQAMVFGVVYFSLLIQLPVTSQLLKQHSQTD